VGTAAPAISLPDHDGKSRSLADFRGRWVALYFYPKNNTPGCTQEAQAFRDRWPDFQKQGIAVIGVSADSVASHKDFARTHKLPFVLLADESCSLAGPSASPAASAPSPSPAAKPFSSTRKAPWSTTTPA